MYANIGTYMFIGQLNACACILNIYFWNFVSDNAWGVPAQKMHLIVVTRSLGYEVSIEDRFYCIVAIRF